MNSEQQVHKKLPDASVEGSGPVPSPDASELAPTTGTSAEDKAEIAIPAMSFAMSTFPMTTSTVLTTVSTSTTRFKKILSNDNGTFIANFINRPQNRPVLILSQRDGRGR